jgi:hypothetical protein
VSPDQVLKAARHPVATGGLTDRRVLLLTGALTSLPVVVATVQALVSGWVPMWDDALIAVRSIDVFSARSPLLGPWSSGYSAIVHEPTFHPGPLLFWLLAPAARLPWPGALEVTIGIVNVASTMGVVALAHRRGGRILMFAVALTLLVTLSSLPAAAYSDIWNPSAAVLPFTLLIFLAWSVACGDYRLLPLTVAVASFVSQCHLTFLVPAGGLFVVALAGLVVSRRRAADGVSTRPWIVASAVVALLCWSFPAIDQAVHRPGNLVLIARAITAHKETIGFDPAWRALVHTVGIVPWWLREPEVPIERIVDLSVRPSWLAIVSAAAFVGGLAATTVIGWRRARLDVAAAGALALVLCASVVLVTASTPTNSGGTLGYTLRWAAPAGMWVWVALGWSAATLGAGRLPATARRWLSGPAGRWAPAAGLAAAAVVAVVVATSAERLEDPFAQMRTVSDRLAAKLPAGRPARMQVSSTPDASFMALAIETGVVYGLRHDGRNVAIPNQVDYLGDAYDRKGGEQPVRVDVGTQPPPHAQVVARLRVVQRPDPAGPSDSKPPPSWTLVVSLVPGDAPD